MSTPTKRLPWKGIADLVGVVAIVASLVFVGLQLRQTQKIAIAQYNVELQSVQSEIFGLINANADVWVRGNHGEQLNEADAAIFKNLVIAVNDQTFYAVEIARLLMDNADAYVQTEVASLAAFLYENPGARTVWETRESDLARYRNSLVSGGNPLSGYPDEVRAALAKLDEAEK